MNNHVLLDEFNNWLENKGLVIEKVGHKIYCYCNISHTRTIRYYCKNTYKQEIVMTVYGNDKPSSFHIANDLEYLQKIVEENQ